MRIHEEIRIMEKKVMMATVRILSLKKIMKPRMLLFLLILSTMLIGTTKSCRLSKPQPPITLNTALPRQLTIAPLISVSLVPFTIHGKIIRSADTSLYDDYLDTNHSFPISNRSATTTTTIIANEIRKALQVYTVSHLQNVLTTTMSQRRSCAVLMVRYNLTENPNNMMTTNTITSPNTTTTTSSNAGSDVANIQTKSGQKEHRYVLEHLRNRNKSDIQKQQQPGMYKSLYHHRRDIKEENGAVLLDENDEYYSYQFVSFTYNGIVLVESGNNDHDSAVGDLDMQLVQQEQQRILQNSTAVQLNAIHYIPMFQNQEQYQFNITSIDFLVPTNHTGTDKDYQMSKSQVPTPTPAQTTNLWNESKNNTSNTSSSNGIVTNITLRYDEDKNYKDLTPTSNDGIRTTWAITGVTVVLIVGLIVTVVTVSYRQYYHSNLAYYCTLCTTTTPGNRNDPENQNPHNVRNNNNDNEDNNNSNQNRIRYCRPQSRGFYGRMNHSSSSSSSDGSSSSSNSNSNSSSNRTSTPDKNNHGSVRETGSKRIGIRKLNDESRIIFL